MRITLVCATLGPGGAERVMALMANHWADGGHDVFLATFNSDARSHYALSKKVVLIPIGLNSNSPTIAHAIANSLWRVSKLRATLSSTAPDIVISFIETANVRVLASLLGSGIPVIVSERTNPSVYRPGVAWDLLRYILYPSAARVVVQTDRVRDYFPRRVRQLCRVIQNPVLQPLAFRKNEKDNNGGVKRILALGRLSDEKGHDLLIQAFAKVCSRHPQWILEIVGEGPARPSLEACRRSLGVDETVHLRGLTETPFDELNRADLFILPSRFEGFPNALCEAMAAGVPVISFDCPNGPREIIRDNVDGILVPPQDVNALAGAMDRLMSNPEERARLALRAPEILDRFGIEHIMKKWEETISEVAPGFSPMVQETR